MRDLERIERLLTQLQEAWSAFPDMRLGQLLINITRSQSVPDFCNLEDAQIEQQLAAFLAQRVLPSGLRHVKRRWDESRGDRHDEFGQSWWYFEIDPNCYVLRQITQYDGGQIFGYNSELQADEHGMLSTVPLERELLDYDFISRDEFENVWGRRGN